MYVTLADKSVVKAVGQGDLNVYLPDKNGRKTPMKFSNVLYVPGIERLISVGQLTKRGAQVIFTENSAILTIGGETFNLEQEQGSYSR